VIVEVWPGAGIVERRLVTPHHVAIDERTHTTPDLRLACHPDGIGWSVQVADGGWEPVAPFDEQASSITPFSLHPGLDLTWTTTVFGGPVPDASVHYRIRSGALAQVVHTPGVGRDPDADLHVSIPYLHALVFRLGRAPAAQLIAPPASFDGDLDVGMMVIGLIDQAWDHVSRVDADTLERLCRLTIHLNGRSLLADDDG